MVAGIIEYLKEHGFRDMVMLEGSWVGDKTREAFETCGFDRLEEEYQVRSGICRRIRVFLWTAVEWS